MGGAALGEIHLGFELAGFGLLFIEILLPFFDVRLIFPGLGGDECSVVAGLQREEIDSDGERLPATTVAPSARSIA